MVQVWKEKKDIIHNPLRVSAQFACKKPSQCIIFTGAFVHSGVECGLPLTTAELLRTHMGAIHEYHG